MLPKGPGASAAVPREQAPAEPAIGPAACPPECLPFDFLPERYERARLARRRRVTWLLAAIAGLSVAWGADVRVMDELPRATRELEAARARQTALARELAELQAEARRRAELAARTQRWLALLRSRDAVRTLASLEAARPAGLLFLQTELGSLIHQTVRNEAVGRGTRLPKPEQVRSVQRVLRLEGLALDTVQVTDFACKLSGDPHWGQVRIESLQRELQGDQALYRFRLQAQVQEGGALARGD